MNHPSINIFVLNWNGRDLTMDCLKSLEQVNYSAHKVYVIDNGSTDDTRQIAEQAMAIAADICVYTNTNLTIEML